VFKIVVSLNSRLDSNKEEEEEALCRLNTPRSPRPAQHHQLDPREFLFVYVVYLVIYDSGEVTLRYLLVLCPPPRRFSWAHSMALVLATFPPVADSLLSSETN